MNSMIEIRAPSILESRIQRASDKNVFLIFADKFNAKGEFIQTHNLAFTQDKIMAASSKKLVLLVNASSWFDGGFRFLVEVIPFGYSFVKREIERMGFHVVIRKSKSPLNNSILEVCSSTHCDLLQLEREIKNIPGVVASSIFAQRTADLVICKQTITFKSVNTFQSRNFVLDSKTDFSEISKRK
ncbi:MAG: hypothetical protein C9356_10185 [Oleiphilus sp.]|nr:MAG: hypothetical protein C9356_10185 [Oleiphilus sp.]